MVLIMKSLSVITAAAAIGLSLSCGSPEVSASKEIIHDAEYYVLKVQNGERWAKEDSELDKKLAELKKKHGTPSNIVYILWDDQPYGVVGFPNIQKNLGLSTPNINKMAAEGINFTRMYSEPSCTPTRAAFLTGRTPVRHGMGVVGMPHPVGSDHGGDALESGLCHCILWQGSPG